MSMEAGPSNAYLASPKHSWWSTQTTKEKKLIIICAIASVLTFIFFMCTVIVGARTRYVVNCAGDESRPTDKPSTEACRTRECRQTAFRMKINMDEEAKPCQNFYDFACGGFDIARKEGESIINDTALEFKSNIEGILKSIISKTGMDEANPAVQVYRSCITEGKENKSDINAIKEMIKEVLGTDWPMAVGKSWNETDFDYNKTIAKLVKLDTKFFLKFGAIPDPKNYTRYSAVLVGVATPLKVPPNLKDIICLLYPGCKEISDLDKEIGELKALSEGTEAASTKTKQEDITLILKTEAMKNTELERYTIQKLKELFPQIEWNVFFQTVFEGSDFKMTSDFQVISKIEPTKIEKYMKNKRLLANAIAFYLIEKWGPLFSAQIELLWNQGQATSKKCHNFVNTYLGFALGKLYIDEYLPEAALTEITGMTHDIKNGFRKLLVRASWLDVDTQAKAKEKVDNMVSVVGSPAFVFNDNAMKEYYKTVTDVKEKSFVVSSRKAVDNIFQQNIKLLSSPLDRLNMWPGTSALVFNAFYYPVGNSMYYPLGMLMSPFFSTGRPRAIKYGSLGYVAGHEIVHGFDSTGRNYDKNGMFNNWWDPETTKKFEVGAKCFVDQYSKIKDEKSEKYLDGNKTLGENIADNGGLRAAYQAYKDAPDSGNVKFIGLETYTEDQLFFIAAAQSWCAKTSREKMEDLIQTDEHSPHKYRAYVPFLNFPEFAKAFQCEEGTPMNPKEKCEIW